MADHSEGRNQPGMHATLSEGEGCFTKYLLRRSRRGSRCRCRCRWFSRGFLVVAEVVGIRDFSVSFANDRDLFFACHPAERDRWSWDSGGSRHLCYRLARRRCGEYVFVLVGHRARTLLDRRVTFGKGPSCRGGRLRETSHWNHRLWHKRSAVRDRRI